MIKAIALDDEPPALQVIASFCSQLNFIQLEKTFYKTIEANKYLEQYPVDLLFLDINMPSVSGIEFYKNISQQSMVIFTTAYSEFAVEGFNLNAIDYLLKPFSYERFAQAAGKAKQYYDFMHQSQNSIKEEYLFIRVDYTLVKLNINDILFIEGLDDYLKIHLRSQKPLVTRLTMKNILEKLPAADFVRIHRSYIVSFANIKSVRNKVVSIAGEEIPIGSSYEAAFLSLFNK